MSLNKTTSTKKQNKSRANARSKKEKGSVENISQKSTSAPLAMSKSVKVKGPKAEILRRGEQRLKNSELLGSPVLLSNFGIWLKCRINPSSETTFRWLSKIARNYESYKFHKLKFHFITRVGATNAGSIYLSPDYDAADGLPITENQVSANVDTAEDCLWKNITLTVDPLRMNRAYKSHFCMSDTRFAQTAQDKKTIDAASVVIAGQSFADQLQVGKLWIEYDVSLYDPQEATELDAFGGAGTNKSSGLNPNTASIFTTNSLATNNQEANPIVSVLPSSNFPGGNLFQFNRDWEGFVSQQATGTGITGGAGLLKNNGVMGGLTMNTVINSGLTQLVRQYYEEFKAGDLLGAGALTATGLTGMIINLGGSSVN